MKDEMWEAVCIAVACCKINQGCDVYSHEYQVNVTRLWNHIDNMEEPEQYWEILAALCSSAFDDDRDPNTLRFAYSGDEECEELRVVKCLLDPLAGCFVDANQPMGNSELRVMLEKLCDDVIRPLVGDLQMKGGLPEHVANLHRAKLNNLLGRD